MLTDEGAAELADGLETCITDAPDAGVFHFGLGPWWVQGVGFGETRGKVLSVDDGRSEGW
jgi:hypothetical protein